jgi:Mrp family chromosome partitioning ATPase
VRVLAEIPARTAPSLRPGTLRRGDLDAFRRLLGGLGGARVVLVTGTGEGRRGAAVGLATAAVAGGRRAALVECDLVEPWLADALGLADAPGLDEYLRGTVKAEDVLKPVVLAGPGSSGASEPLVCVVAGRPSAEGGPRLLASAALSRALAGLRTAYELVVIAGPPLKDEYSLRALLALADATIACLPPSEPRDLPISVSGLVIQH